MKHFEAILFDFNGTLYLDGDANEWAWRQTINELSEGKIDFDAAYSIYKGVRNYLFVSYAFKELGFPADEEKKNYWVKRKETEYYQRYCKDRDRRELAPGAEELLDLLKEKQIPFNLCTSSIEENVDFYFGYIGMDRWFEKDRIAYDDGTFPDKIAMYKAAAERIGTDIGRCLVIEDSPASIREALAAGCGGLIAIRKPDTPSLPGIIQVIGDLREFDYSLIV